MTVKNWLTLVSLSLIWGFSFLFIKVGVQGFTPVWVTGVRVIFGLLFLLPLLRLRGESLPPRRYWAALLVGSALNNVVAWFLLSWAELSISSGVASILNATTPLFSILIASTWGDEALDLKRLLGVATGMAGVALLVGADLRGLGAGALLPELGVLLVSLLYAIGASFVRRFLSDLPPHHIATGQLTAGLVLVLPFMLAEGAPTVMPDMQVIGAVAVLGFVGTGMAYLLFFNLLRDVGATRTLVVTLLVPLGAVFWGWLLLDEVVGWRSLVGMAVILLGVILVNSDSFRRMLLTNGARRAKA